MTAVIILSALPRDGCPCGFDQYGRPVGLQLVGKPRGEAALLQTAALFEQLTAVCPACCRSILSRVRFRRQLNADYACCDR